MEDKSGDPDGLLHLLLGIEESLVNHPRTSCSSLRSASRALVTW
jgi:hypothetical protein